MSVTLIALRLALTRKVPVLGVVVASSRSKAMVMVSPSISAVLTLRGWVERLVRLEMERLEMEARSLPLKSSMTVSYTHLTLPTNREV